MSVTYQLLVLDPSKKTGSENALSLLHCLRGFTKLWLQPKITDVEVRITDGQSLLSVVDVEAPKDTEGA